MVLLWHALKMRHVPEGFDPGVAQGWVPVGKEGSGRIPVLPVAEHRASCAQLVREQDVQARSEPTALPASLKPLNSLLEFKASRQH